MFFKISSDTSGFPKCRFSPQFKVALHRTGKQKLPGEHLSVAKNGSLYFNLPPNRVQRTFNFPGRTYYNMGANRDYIIQDRTVYDYYSPAKKTRVIQYLTLNTHLLS